MGEARSPRSFKVTKREGPGGVGVMRIKLPTLSRNRQGCDVHLVGHPHGEGEASQAARCIWFSTDLARGCSSQGLDHIKQEFHYQMDPKMRTITHNFRKILKLFPILLPLGSYNSDFECKSVGRNTSDSQATGHGWGVTCIRLRTPPH